MTLAHAGRGKNLRSAAENNMLKLGQYQHYKGGKYEVIGIARHSETNEELVIYRALYGDRKIWARPLAIFLEEVEVKGKKIPRFKYIKAKNV